MKFEISPNRRSLTIIADEQDRKLLREGWDNPGETDLDSDKALHEFFEGPLANSEFQWVQPEWCGDLTDAPILGLLGDDVGESEVKTFPANYHGWREIGFNGREKVFQPVLERWAFLDYQVRSPLADLLENGKVIFTN